MTVFATPRLRWNPTLDELSMLLRWLDFKGVIYTLEQAISVVEHPDRWHAEYVDMLAEQARLEESDPA